jgi:hypothetical protein
MEGEKMPDNIIDSDATWSLTAYVKHNEGMRVMEEKLQTERDRRYAEVNVEKEKALKIKETADLTALELARESQVYKDERNDSRNEQSIKQTGIYATRDDIAMVLSKMDEALKPLIKFVNAQQGSSVGVAESTNKFHVNTSTIIGIIGIVFLIITYFK